MPMSMQEFKTKMRTDETARSSLVQDIQKALQKQGIDTNDPVVMKELGFKVGDPKDLGNVASTVVITIVM